MLDCELEIENTREIALRGTSAHRKLALYNEAIKSGADKQEALVQVVDAPIIETVSGV